MKGPSPNKLRQFVERRLGLNQYLRAPGDGRPHPHIKAHNLLWAVLACQILREASFLAVERMVGSKARRELGVTMAFGDDALSYFFERLDPKPTRLALAGVARRAKRNKAFDDCFKIGIALDGTGAGHCSMNRCELCHPVLDSEKKVVGHLHHFSMASIIGPPGLTLPVDVEPYGPGDCEYNAGQRLLARVVQNLGKRYADFVVADGEFATAPFLHAAGDVGLRVVARLKGNLPELFSAAQARFADQPPQRIADIDGDQVELWDADDFDPWETLRWTTVRVLRYRQHKPDGTVVEAYWLSDFPTKQVGSIALYRFAKSRWRAIENQGFNVGKCYHGLEHIPHHHAGSLLCWWLIVALALTIERLYRLRYLRRGTHTPMTAVELVHKFRLSLAPSFHRDTG